MGVKEIQTTVQGVSMTIFGIHPCMKGPPLEITESIFNDSIRIAEMLGAINTLCLENQFYCGSGLNSTVAGLNPFLNIVGQFI